MRYLVTVLGLFVLANINGQDIKKIECQFDLGTTVIIPYKKTIEVMPQFNGHPQTDYSSNLGYFFEFIISYNVNKKVAINSGLNCNFNRIKVIDKIGFTENKGNLTNSYLYLPILIDYRVSDKAPISISVGPYFGMLLSAREKGTSYFDTSKLVFSSELISESDPIINSIEPSQKYDRDIKKDYSKFDVGLTLQVSYELKLNSILTGIVFTRFNYGFIDVITNDLVNNNSADVWKNYNLMIGFGIKL